MVISNTNNLYRENIKKIKNRFFISTNSLGVAYNFSSINTYYWCRYINNYNYDDMNRVDNR